MCFSQSACLSYDDIYDSEQEMLVIRFKILDARAVLDVLTVHLTCLKLFLSKKICYFTLLFSSIFVHSHL